MKNFSIKGLTKVIINNVLLIIICAIIFGGLFGLFAHHKESTTYNASRAIMVTHNFNRSKEKSSAVEADQHLIPTYQDILTDNTISKAAKKNLPKKIRTKYTVNQINHAVSSSAKGDSLIIVVHAKTDNEKDSIALVNAVTKAFKTELPKIDAQAGKVHLLSKATEDSVVSNTSPSVKKYAILGIGLGILLGMVLSVLLTTWKNFL